MAANDGLHDDQLVGPAAVEWLFGRPNGGHFFDGALMGVGAAFGNEARVGAFAPLELNGDASHFFLAVEGRIDSQHDWERLAAAHLSLFEQASRGKRRSTTRGEQPRYPFRSFHLIMEPHPPSPVMLNKTTDAWLRLR
jgi:hypothetical protein